jgi:pyruvate/2-oxoglutarate dehydrogenase complex dihydrolipoamide acyltransferase (E2) component
LSARPPCDDFWKPTDLSYLLHDKRNKLIVIGHVKEGDQVVTDQPLVSVETDKAVLEVPSTWGGRIARVFGTKGDLVKVGAPLVEFAAGTEQDTSTVVGQLDTGEKPSGHECREQQ